METELRREPLQRRLSEEELSQKINELRQSGRYTPEELRSIMNQLRQSGLYPPKVGPAQGLKDFLRTSESTRRPLSEEESLISKEILQQPGHEPSKVGSMQSKLKAKSVQGAKSAKKQLKDKPTSPPKLPPERPQTSTLASPSGLTPSVSWISKPPVAVGRLPLLVAEIENLKEKLGATQKGIQHLELKKAKCGIDFPVSDAIELEERIEGAKKFALEIKVLEKERELQKRYETELVAAAPIHMALSIAQKGGPTYIDTLAMCEKIMKPLFDDHSLLLGYSEGILARQFKDRAALESQKSGQQISAKELIEREIKYLEDLASYHKDALLQGHRLDSLRKAKGALESDQQPVSFSPVPADPIAQALPQLPGSEGSYGICLQFGEKRRLKITVLPLSSIEDQEGSILIYEGYSETNTKVRIACTYNRVWSSSQFNFSKDRDLFSELDKLRGACRLEVCSGKMDDCYRLPYCVMFLRSIDEYEQSDNRLLTNGVHIPICMALQHTVMEEGQRVLKAEDVQSKSIPDWMFAELFNRGMLGSDWLERKLLHDLYKFLARLLPTERIKIHAQEYGYPVQEDDTSGASD